MFALGDEAHVHTAAEVLNGTCEVGEKTVIIGGGLVGCETAIVFTRTGKESHHHRGYEKNPLGKRTIMSRQSGNVGATDPI